MTSRRKGTVQSGFTLIEVMAALAILGLALGLVASRGPARAPGLDLRATASEVSRTLRAARALAIAKNQPVIVGRDIAWPRVSGSVRAILPPAGIRFDALGSSVGGRVILSAGTARQDVVVHWFSGRVEVSNAQ